MIRGFPNISLNMKGERAGGYLLSVMVVLVMCLFLTPVSHAAQVDISNMVEWDASRSMYMPTSYTHSLFFDGYTPANERVNGAIFMDFRSTENFDAYFSLSALTGSKIKLTRITMEIIPGLTFPYVVVDSGYKPDTVGSQDIDMNFTVSPSGFGGSFMDWQLSAQNPAPHNSVYAGSIYYNKLSGGGAIDLEEVLAPGFAIDSGIKVEGDKNFQTTGAITIVPPAPPVVAAPEISPGAFNLLLMFLCPGLLILRRAIRR